jgi:phosphoenolpyruvate carboxykinase (ATP)
MPASVPVESRRSLSQHDITNVNAVYWNLPTPLLYEEALRRHEARLAHMGPLVVRTGEHTGRSPRDKFLVRESPSADDLWWGDVNRPMSPDHFERLRHRLLSHLQGRDLFVQDCFAGADPAYRLPIRVITETAWHSLFARNMFIRATPEELAGHVPQFTVIDVPSFHAIPEQDGTRSEVFVAIHFGKRLVLIGGTQYAGEIKKSMFTVLNYLLPQQGVLTMHCSANVGPGGGAAVFFGLSGTGKTTLSADPARTLIGDDEHGWSERGLFNLEGGCYAKVIRLSPEAEPDIYETTRRFGTILENVGCDSATARLDLDDDSLTENTRAAYPMTHIANASRDGLGPPSLHHHHAHRGRLRGAPSDSRGSRTSRRCTTSSPAIRRASPEPRRASRSRKLSSAPTSALPSWRGRPTCTPDCCVNGSRRMARRCGW